MAGMANPTSGSIDRAVMRDCVRAAIAAPSVHNTQPWLFRVREDGVDVLVDRSRRLRTLDPLGREMFVSVGAALFNLRVALRAHGFETFVQRCPGPAEPDLAARVRVAVAAEVPSAARKLAEAVRLRHTNRRPFAERPVSDRVLNDLANAASAEQASLLVVDDVLREGVLSLTRTAEKRLRDDDQYRAEIAAWTTPGGVGRRDGVPREAVGPRARDAALPLRDFAFGRGMPTVTVEFEANPTIILLLSAGDDERAWLRAGEALQRVLLTATVHGLAATPLSQLTEIPALRGLLADQATGQIVQTVLRVGYPVTAARATPRRDLDDVIIGDPAGS
jgi:nitroreductase